MKQAFMKFHYVKMLKIIVGPHVVTHVKSSERKLAIREVSNPYSSMTDTTIQKLRFFMFIM